MKHGLVFRADKGETLLDTLAQAVTRFRVRFGTEPSGVYVHPEAVLDTPLKVVKSKNVQPNHLWLEIEKEMTNVEPEITCRA